MHRRRGIDRQCWVTSGPKSCRALKTKVDQRSFRTWFEPTALVADHGEKVTIRVPSVLCRDWLAKHYAGVISEAASEVERGGLQIAFVIQDRPGGSPGADLRIRRPQRTRHPYPTRTAAAGGIGNRRRLVA